MRSLELYALPDLHNATERDRTEAFSGSARRYPLATFRLPEQHTFRHASSSSYSEETCSLFLLLSATLHGVYLYEVYINADSGEFQVLLRGEHALGDKEGFVGAFALGQEGKRGLWIERRRVNTQRNVVAFTSPLLSDKAPQDSRMCRGTAPLEKNIVWESRSFDLRGMRIRPPVCLHRSMY